MIPLQLHLTDFLSYRQMPEPLDLTGVHVACLSGPNGHGKSALLDAITWALWGKARGCEGGHDQERLIRDGAEAMRVEFVFELEGQVYRVVRSRRRTGKAPEIGFNVRAPDGSWTDLAGEGIADTQRRITERLRMDYETFVTSAFILQGRADTFTKLDPRDRKDVLAKILGLEIYERLAERAKERRKEAHGDAETHARVLETLERDLAERPNLERRREETAAELAGAEAARALAEETLEAARAGVAELRAVRAAASEAERRRDHARETVERERASIGELNARRKRLETEARVDDAVRVDAGTVQDLERQERLLDEARSRHTELTGEIASVEARVGEERARLEAERAAHRRAADALERDLAAVPDARALLDRARAEMIAADGAEAEREQLLARHAEIRERIATIEAERAARETERTEIAEKVDLLEHSDAACPLCGGELSPEHRKRVRSELTARTKQLDTAERDAGRERRALEAERKKVDARGAELRDAIDRRRSLAEQAATLQEKLDRLDGCATEHEAAIATIAELEARLAHEDYAAGEREKLIRLREDLGRVAYDPAEHASVKKRLERARNAERTLAAAARAQADLDAAIREHAAAVERSAAADEALARADAELGAMTERIATLPRLEAELADAERVRADVQRRVEAAGQTLAATAQALEVLERKAEQAAAAKLARDAARRMGSLYERLGKAFGRDGIPARIIGNAIPELRIEANRLLGLLSDGQLSVSIDPVRETKGRALKETLDVTVYDAAGGKRAYEMYSGGERLRIDFALRVALSRLLSTRAGARLETLVVDEGFGSQDSEGRARLLEAVMKVRSEFRTVLVVTHIEELKEHFPHRIEVRKDPEAGSRVVVV